MADSDIIPFVRIYSGEKFTTMGQREDLLAA
ncbi:MAG: hypothetical protein ACJAY7_000043 [Pseudohongiellaceae bacterium]|jgi:hypothetical protein